MYTEFIFMPKYPNIIRTKIVAHYLLFVFQYFLYENVMYNLLYHVVTLSAIQPEKI